MSVSDTPKRFVYLLRSLEQPHRPYIRLTSDVAARLRAHNAGQNPSTVSHRPWELVVSLEFQNEAVAVRFEKYSKSGSGRAFAKRHFS
jgi:predicted GIY-YIG superfamily endonuclease